MRKFFPWVVVGAFFVPPVHAQTGATLFSYGAAAGDTAIARGDDLTQTVALATAGPAGTTVQVPFYGGTYSTLAINTNGFVAFGPPDAKLTTYESSSPTTWSALGGTTTDSFGNFPLQNPKPITNPIVAPFLSDVDTRFSPSGQVWYRTVTDTASLATYSNFINGSFAGAANFTASMAQVITWDGVSNYNLEQASSSRNTFQMLLVSDGVRTYTAFLYPQGGINWLRASYPSTQSGVLPSNFPQAGFDAGDGVNAANLPGTRTAGMSSLPSLSNTAPAQPGVFVYDLSTPATLSTTNYGATPTTVNVMSTFAETLQLGASGFTFNGGTGSVLQFQSLSLAQPTDTVSFTGSLAVLTFAANAVTAGNLNFGGSTILVARGTSALNGGTINLASNAQLQLYDQAATTHATTLTFDKSGGGTGGTLDLRAYSTTLGAISSASSGAGIITNSGATSGTLTLDSASSTTFSGVIQNGAGGLALVKTGAGTLTLSGANTYTGGTTISNGTLALGAAGVLADGGAVTVSGGTLALGAFNETVGAFSLSSGSLTGTGALTASSLAFSGADLTVGTPLAGAGALTKSGAGTLTLSTANSYTGGTAINGGIVSISANNQLGSGGGTLSFDGGTLKTTTGGIVLARTTTLNAGGGTFDITGAVQLNNPISGTGAFTKTGSGTFTLLGNNSYGGGTTISQGTLQIGNGANGGVLPGDAVNNASLIFNRANAVTYAANITGSGNVTKNGGGELILTGTFAQTGGTTISAGTLTLGSGDRLADTGNVTINGGTLALGTFNDTVGAFSLTSGSLTGTGTLTASSFALGGAGTIDAVLAGSGALTKSGTGTLTLTGATTFSGNTTVSGGTLALSGGANRLPTGTTVFLTSGGTLDLGGTTQTVAGAGSSTSRLVGDLTHGTLNTAGALFLQSGTYDVSLTGSGTAARVWVGGDTSATVTLNGTNSMVRTSDHNQLIIGHSTTGAAGTVKAGNPNALAADTENIQIFSGTLDLNGQSGVRGKSIAFASAANGSLVNSNTSAAASFNQPISFSAGITAKFGGAGDLTLGGVLSGGGAVSKSGAGTLTLSGNNTYSGATSVTGGQLKLNGSAANSAFTLSGGGVLSGSGTAGTVTVSSGGRISPGNSPGTLATGGETWAGGGAFTFELNHTTGTAGGDPGWDLLSISGALAINATNANPFTLSLASLTLANAAGRVDDFNAASNYSFTFVATTGGITGFNANAFTLDASAFQNPFAGTWSVGLANGNRDLALTYTGGSAIPEPSTYAAWAGGAMLALAAWRKRRRRA